MPPSFALGGYAMGMYLMRQIGPRGVYGDPILPDFMVFLNYKELPWFWHGMDMFWFAMLMVIVVPGLLALVFGWLAFRSRVTGVYLSIITQAMTFALMLSFFRNDMGFGGNNGFTDFKDLLGFNLKSPTVRIVLLVTTVVMLAIGYLLCRWIVSSRTGRVVTAIRDAESRVRFIGYRVENYKLWVFVFSAVLAGIAGALYVPQIGIINPGEFAPINSIEVVIWVAIGGRGTLYGAIAGAVLVNYAKTWFTTALPSAWLYLLGALFVITTLLLPMASPACSVRARPGSARHDPGPRLRQPAAAAGQHAAGGHAGEAGRAGAEEARRRPFAQHRQVPPRYGLHPLPRGPVRRLRWLQGHQQPDAVRGDRRAPLHHRTQRRRQDHDDGHHHRQDPADSGSAWFGQTIDLLAHTEPEIAQAGIGRKFQKPTVFEKHTAFQNLELSLAGNRGVWPNLVAKLSTEQRDRISGVLAQIGLAEAAETPAGRLSHGQKQWLEIGMLLMQSPRLLLVDEPVAGMTPQEVEKTAELLVELSGDHSVIVVEHDMEFVRKIAKRVTVLHQGSVLAEGSMDEVQANSKVVEVYLGEQ